MESIYLISATNPFLIKEKIDALKFEASMDELSIVKEDALSANFDDILQELTTISFFNETKLIVIENVEAFNRYSTRDLQAFYRYLENPSSDIMLILTTLQLNESNELFQQILRQAYLVKIDEISLKQLPAYIKNLFVKEGYEIGNEVIDLLIERCGQDLYRLHQEIEKLKIYGIDDKVIDVMQASELIGINFDDNIFLFSQSWLDRDLTTTMRIYHDFMATNQDPLSLLNALFSSYNMILQAMILMKQGYKREQLAQHFQISSGRAYYLEKNAKEQDYRRLENMINRLEKLDYEIKSGQKDKKLGLQLLLLGAR